MNNQSPQKKKVLFAIANMGIGGAEKLLSAQLKCINKNIFDAYLVTLLPEGEHSLLGTLGLPKEKIVYFYFPSYFRLASWLALIRWMKREKFDVVVCNLLLANTVVRIASYLAGVKNIIVVEHNLYPAKKRIYFILERLLARITSRIIAVSYDVKQFLAERGGIPESKIEVVYDGVDLDAFRGFLDSRGELREKFGFAQDEIIIASVGRGSIQKGYDVLVETAGEVKKQAKTKFRFIVAGNKNPLLQGGFDLRVQELGLDGVVEFWGLRQDVPELLGASDIFFMPSRWEGFGIVLVEAMATGLPFVAHAVGMVSRQDRAVSSIQDGVHGFIVEDYMPERFAERLAKLVEDEVLRKKLGAASSEKAYYFSMEKNVSKLERILVS